MTTTIGVWFTPFGPRRVPSFSLSRAVTSGGQHGARAFSLGGFSAGHQSSLSRTLLHRVCGVLQHLLCGHAQTSTGHRSSKQAPPPAGATPARTQGALAGERGERESRAHQCRGSTALPGGGRTPPLVMPISSPREPASGGNENSPWGAPPQSLLAPVTRRHHPSSGGLPAEFQAHRSRRLHPCLPVCQSHQTAHTWLCLAGGT